MPTDNGDVAKVVKFLKDSKSVLSEVVTMKDDLFPTQLHQPVDKAWTSVEKRIDELINWLNRVQYNDYLSYVGLTGDELNFKLIGFYESKNLWDGIKASVESLKKLTWKKILKNVLEWMNIILSSLNFVPAILNINFIPISLADPIREFKDALEAGTGLKEIGDEIKPKKNNIFKRMYLWIKCVCFV